MTNLAPTLSSESDDWYTPRKVLDVIELIAPIALDPFPADWNPAVHENGFDRSWNPGPGGLTFDNWPYSENEQHAACWAAEHPRHNDKWHLVGLGPARPDTQWFKSMREHSRALCFWEGRIKFLRGNGKPATVAPFPSVLFYAGPAPGCFRDVFSRHGWVVTL